MPSASAAEIRDAERTRLQEFNRRLARADKDTSHMLPVARRIMPVELKEISGLTLTPSGKLLTHDDNVGRVFVLDPKTGVALKQFFVGDRLRGDFEAITTAGSDIYMLQSNGKIYRFSEGGNGATVPFQMWDTKLGHECEFEGLVYDPDSTWLVMPCKNASNKKMKDDLVLYRWRLTGPDSARLSMMTVPLDLIVSGNGWKSFRPTDITLDPATHNYVLISSHEKGLVEITRAGDVERSEKLPGRHNQPEGIAITKDNILIISDEENRSPAAITLYRWRP
jgi:uncharacterized protein YjiK